MRTIACAGTIIPASCELLASKPARWNEEDDGLRQLRIARVGDVVLIDKLADLRSPRWIDCYVVEVENFAGRDSKKFKLNLERILFSLQYQHNGVPADFNLLLLGEPRRWFDAVATLLPGELNRRDPHLFDRLHTPG